jgi:alpha-1,2-rhamnosyltransferase
MAVYIDCSTLYHHPEHNTGIQRVVRQLVHHGSKIAQQYETTCQPMMLMGQQFYVVAAHQLAVPESPSSMIISATDSHRETVWSQWRRRIFKPLAQQIYQGVKAGLLRIVPGASATQFLLAPRYYPGLDAWVHRILNRLAGITQPAHQPSSAAIEFKAGDQIIIADANWYLGLWSALRLARQRGARIHTIIYDLIAISHPQYFEAQLVRCYQQWLAASVPVTDQYLTTTITVQQALQHYLSKQQKTTTALPIINHFPLGADFQEVLTESIRDDVQSLFTTRSVYIVVCTIEPRKNHAYVLTVFEQLWAQGLDMTLCFIGRPGWLVDSLMRRIHQHPYWQRQLYHFADITDQELVFCYRQAQLLLFPSFIEGFGLPIIEALHYGTPVFASDIAVHREIAKDHIHYFDPYNPDDLVAQLLDYHAHPARYRQSIQKHDLAWPNWQASVEQCMKHVLGAT